MAVQKQSRQSVDQIWILRITGWPDPDLHADAALLEDKPPQSAGDREAAEDAVGIMAEDASSSAPDRRAEIPAQGRLCPLFQLPEGIIDRG
ncbi:MAG: hypothetical protein WCE63_07045 [Acidobacteriaceae bacterium]